jgi:hypothetical protein
MPQTVQEEELGAIFALLCCPENTIGQTPAFTLDEAYDDAERIFDGLKEGRIGIGGTIIYTDFVPANDPSFIARFSTHFGLSAGEESQVRASLPYLRGLGASVESKPIRRPMQSSHGGATYPAEIRVEVHVA